jgi:hypothetical protein
MKRKRKMHQRPTNFHQSEKGKKTHLSAEVSSPSSNAIPLVKNLGGLDGVDSSQDQWVSATR